MSAPRRMTWVDYSILGVFAASVLLGVWRGLTREVFSLATWIGAFIAAWMFSAPMAVKLTPHIDDPLLRMAVASAGVFLFALLVGAILTHLLVGLVRGSGFSPADRTLGGGLGLVRAVVFVGLFVLIAGRMGANESKWWRESALVVRFVPLAQSFESVVPERWLDMLKPAVASNPSPGQ